ncbi:MAG: zeta toxin family protein [Bacteroidaceae bacterium]|nr:zeta toxin family protein [Bacteroidaceae bacterium]
MKKKPVMCIVAGPNGSGKTTTTEQLLKNEWGADSLYINPDNIAKDIYGDWNSTEAVLKAAQKATEQRYECLKNGTDFVFETVFSSAEKIDFIQKAKDAGFFIRIFYVCTESPLININRIAQRYLNGGHEVPISKTISRYYSSLKNISRAIKIADRVYLYDNSVENAAPKLILRTSDGIIAKQYTNDLPDWVRAII